MTEFVKVAGVETPVEVAQILNKIIDEKGNVDLDNLSEVGEKRFSDLSSSITNVKNSVSSLTTTVNGKIGATVSKAANGYIKFTNGVILQWGILKIQGISLVKVNFPLSYTKFGTVVSTHITTLNSADNTHIVSVKEITNSSFYIVIPKTDWIMDSSWLAIGY